MLRYLTGGESHGQGLIGIIEGIPSNLNINIDYIDKELKRRQMGYGRGGRMKIEQDTVKILSGVRQGKTMGSPISLFIENKDWKNWQDIMSVDGDSIDSHIVTRPRPGHGDLVGAIKYNQKDIRNILERASARETAMRVAIGAIAKLLIKELGVRVYSHVIQIGKVRTPSNEIDINNMLDVDKSSLRVIDKKSEMKMIDEIDSARENGDTLGGIFEIIVEGAPIGLGSHVSWDRKLDGKIAQAIMSLQGIKAVEIGEGLKSAEIPGSQFHDEIFYSDKYFRNSNNAGGIEAGISNGNRIVIRAAMKPIPSLSKPLKSIDMITKESFEAQKERADVCAVPSASIIGEAIIAWVIAEEIVIKFGGDSLEEMKNNYNSYLSYLVKR